MNFSWSVGGFPRCQASYCAGCYTSNNKTKFFKMEVPESLHPDATTNAKWRHKKACEDEFEVARPGDHLLTPFQCDTCVFRRLHQRDPEPRSNSDNLLLAFIRRANLDAFWSRASGTVKNTRSNVQRTVESLSMFGLSGPFFDPGPSASHDSFGYETAISVLVDSQKAGRYCLSHKQ